MNKTFEDWLNQGGRIYDEALAEYQQLEQELAQLEQRLAAKREEVNEIARVVGRPLLDSNNHRLTAELVSIGEPRSVPNTRDTIARALSGGTLGR